MLAAQVVRAVTPEQRTEHRRAARQVRRWLKTQVGMPYVFGSQGPYSWDCSSLLSHAWGMVGARLTPYTGAMIDECDVVGLDESGWMRGDLIFYYGDHHHVSQYVGRPLGWPTRMVIAATDTSHGVEWIPYDKYAQPTAVRRVRRPAGGFIL